MSSVYSAQLRSVENANISLEYGKAYEQTNSNKPTSMVSTEGLSINVERSDLNEGDNVRAVFQNKKTFKGNSNSNYRTDFNNDVQIVDLKYVGEGKFTAPLQDVILSSNGYSGNLFTAQECSLVINGEWQDDPMNASHNFQMNLSNIL